MEPIGLNVGGYYLTAVAEDSWLADRAYTWAVREATTGDSVGEVTLLPGGDVTVRAVDGAGDPDGLRLAAEAVGRFAASL